MTPHPFQLDLASIANEDKEFRYTARSWDAVVRFVRDQIAYDAVVVAGQVVTFGPAVTEARYDVRFAGSSGAWDALLAAVPEPGHANARFSKGIVLDGDIVAQTGPYAAALACLIRLLRNAVSGPVPIEWVRTYPFKDSDLAVGRYIYYEVGGIEYRVYYEQAGQGVPLMLQHTAGADSRQWRHLLADPRMQEHFQMTAYDLPYHGKSLPPIDGLRWWEGDYAPSKQDLHERVVGLKRALDLDRPIFMGTSLGGQLAPEMIGHFPNDFRGAVSINGWYCVDASRRSINEYLHHPRIHPDYYASMMYEGTSPTAPEPFRRENTWIYASGGPAVYKGDNEYFTDGHDLRDDGHLIDTTVTPLYVVVGEYDPSAELEGGARDIAKYIQGSKFKILPGMSHFAMSDDPVRFNAAIKPILHEIAEDARRIAERRGLGSQQGVPPTSMEGP